MPRLPSRASPPGSAASSDPRAARASVGEAAALAFVLAWFLWHARAPELWNAVLGTDWVSYLRNVMAVGTSHWEAYNVWRGPLHAVATLLFIPLTGTSVSASKAVSITAAAVTVPAVWAIARALGVRRAVWCAIVLGSWPDLPVIANFSTMYPLLMALVAAGTALLLADRTVAAALAGCSFGLAGAADLRGIGLGLAVLVGLLIVRFGRRQLQQSLVCIATGSVVLGLVLASIPLTLLPLGDQIAAHATLTPVSGPVGLAATNARTLATMGPHLAALTALALVSMTAWRQCLPLALPVAAVLASALVVPVQFRYFVPIAPFVAVLAVVGAEQLVGRLAPRVAHALLAALVLSWYVSDDTLVHRLRSNDGEHAGELRSAGLVERDDAAQAIEGALRRPSLEAVVDCSGTDIVEVLAYPTPVRHPRREQCRTAETTGVPGSETSLLVSSEPGHVSGVHWKTESVVPVGELHVKRDSESIGVYTSVAPRQ